MCFTAATAMLLTAGATVGSALIQQDTARKARHAAEDAARMADANQKAAETKATQSANNAIAMRRRALASQSLVTGGGDTAGKQTLGG